MSLHQNQYRELRRVTTRHASIPVNLLLQTRTLGRTKPYYCLSWRTRYPSGRANRRFYYSTQDGGFWQIPISTALSVLEMAEENDMLSHEYDDPQIRCGGSDNIIYDSRRIGVVERRSLFHSIASGVDEPEWGTDPVFLVFEVPDGTWRKIMIVNTEREFCTFRSTTIDEGYGLKSSRIELADAWVLDNSMQDASAAMMRGFLRVLREL